jgi:hypothetical protein
MMARQDYQLIGFRFTTGRYIESGNGAGHQRLSGIDGAPYPTPLLLIVGAHTLPMF